MCYSSSAISLQCFGPRKAQCVLVMTQAVGIATPKAVSLAADRSIINTVRRLRGTPESAEGQGHDVKRDGFTLTPASGPENQWLVPGCQFHN